MKKTLDEIFDEMAKTGNYVFEGSIAMIFGRIGRKSKSLWTNALWIDFSS